MRRITMKVSKPSDLCVMCNNNPTSKDYSRKINSNNNSPFSRDDLLTTLLDPGKKLWSGKKGEESLCSSCKFLLSSAICSKSELQKWEKDIRRRQRELLNELRKLEGEISTFKMWMLKMDEIVTSAKGVPESGTPNWEFLQIKQQVFKVVDDLKSFHQCISNVGWGCNVAPANQLPERAEDLSNEAVPSAANSEVKLEPGLDNYFRTTQQYGKTEWSEDSKGSSVDPLAQEDDENATSQENTNSWQTIEESSTSMGDHTTSPEVPDTSYDIKIEPDDEDCMILEELLVFSEDPKEDPLKFKEIRQDTGGGEGRNDALLRKNPTIPCVVCGKEISNKQMAVHLRVHSREKPFECEFCLKRFTQSSVLMRHRRIHTGEKPFKCELCDAAYAQKYGLTYHWKSAHKL